MTLVVRMAASVANYDYIVDWEFQTDGLVRIKVSLNCIHISLFSQVSLSVIFTSWKYLPL